MVELVQIFTVLYPPGLPVQMQAASYCGPLSVKAAAISSVPVFPLLPITSRLVKKNKLKACLDSGIRSAYTTGLTKELKKNIKKVTRKMLLVILYPRKTIRL